MISLNLLRLSICAEQLDEIQYIDRPDIEIPATSDGANGAGPNESVSMPFKYVRADDGRPILPEVSPWAITLSFDRARKADCAKGMLELLAKDADKDILDLL